MRSYLKKPQYIYPYQQAIGYILDVSGFKSPVVALLTEDVSEFNFYLDYRLKEPILDKKWKIFIPKDFPQTVG